MVVHYVNTNQCAGLDMIVYTILSMTNTSGGLQLLTLCVGSKDKGSHEIFNYLFNYLDRPELHVLQFKSPNALQCHVQMLPVILLEEQGNRILPVFDHL